MEKWLELFLLANKVIWVQIKTAVYPIKELFESGMNSFWFVFAITIIAGILLIEAVNRIITFYQSHNFIHRKMTFEHSRDIEYSLFLQNLWQKERSKGLVGNAKSAKSKYLQFNSQERLFIQNYLQQRVRFLRSNQSLFLLAALFIGLISSIAAGVLPINSMKFTLESTVKTTLFLLVWLFIMQTKYVSLKKQAYHHLTWMQETNRSVSIDLLDVDAAVSVENEINPSY
ncbi:hypothetical protein [Fictibacillus barbaricus]|uniref:SMODS and SLOG-associating 2TM effector domain-containing protein n=1 Tax=Fictibacillus barbaricus TaxID=182136 RepID=A0ABU1U3Y8_9BACL|nr:hypothetical protein [Fictibacillus barbaricus]MDR7074128.1 hypothetical protein [Fictibacillus barbaricus]